MIKILLFAFISLISLRTFAQELEIIAAKQIEKSSDIYENSIEGYKTNEFWGIWTMPIGDAFSTSELKAQGKINYSIKNVSDYDLNTAWIEGKMDYGIGERFGFTFNFPENTEYGGAYQFYGIINLFNGYCKSLETWQQNSRVRKLKVYYNDTPVCIVELIDVWHFQYFDIGKFFKFKRDKKYMDAPYEIKQGDKLTFEIVDVYAGTKYKDVAISEFMAEGAGN
jgi:hypothetical protein